MCALCVDLEDDVHLVLAVPVGEALAAVEGRQHEQQTLTRTAHHRGTHDGLGGHGQGGYTKVRASIYAEQGRGGDEKGKKPSRA